MSACACRGCGAIEHEPHGKACPIQKVMETVTQPPVIGKSMVPFYENILKSRMALQRKRKK